jgi:hypothetical protein
MTKPPKEKVEFDKPRQLPPTRLIGRRRRQHEAEIPESWVENDWPDWGSWHEIHRRWIVSTVTGGRNSEEGCGEGTEVDLEEALPLE